MREETDYPLCRPARRAVERVERELGASVTLVRGRRAVDADARLCTWAVPAEYDGSYSYWGLAVPEYGTLFDCFKVPADDDPDAYRSPWARDPAGTVRPGAVYDFVGLFRIPQESWTEAALEALIDRPLRAALDPATAERQDAERMAVVRGAFSDYARRGRRSHYEGTADAVRARRRQVSLLRKQLGQAVATLRADELALARLEVAHEGDELVREFDLLVEHPRVAQVKFVGSRLVVTTTDDFRLSARDGSWSRWLGAFQISLDMVTTEIKIRNLSTRRGSSDHPHIHDGVICFGEYGAMVAELAGKGELLTLFEYLSQFLENYDPTDEYARYASLWANTPDERPERGEEAAGVLGR